MDMAVAHQPLTVNALAGRVRRGALRELLTQRIQISATTRKLLHLASAVDTLGARAQEGQ
jgi:hypothetical protein